MLLVLLFMLSVLGQVCQVASFGMRVQLCSRVSAVPYSAGPQFSA